MPRAAWFTPLLRRVCLAQLHVEAFINLANGALSLLAPGIALAPLLARGALCPAAEEVQRTFGALNFALGGALLLRVLRPLQPRALKPLLEALLLGDVLYLAAFAALAARVGGAAPGVAAPFALTAPMFALRLALLLGEDWRAAAGEGGGDGAPYASLAASETAL